MAPIGIAVLGLGALLIYAFTRSSSEVIAVDKSTGTMTAKVKGKSGTEYITESTASSLGHGRDAMVTVYLPPQSGAMMNPLIQYNQQGTDKSTRKLTWRSPTATAGLINQAIADFEVKS